MWWPPRRRSRWDVPGCYTINDNLSKWSIPEIKIQCVIEIGKRCFKCNQNQTLASIWLHFPGCLLSLLCTTPINRFLQVIAFVLSCHISGSDKIELLLLSKKKKSLQHECIFMYWTPILLNNQCLFLCSCCHSCMTSSLFCRCPLMWSSVCRNWREGYARSTGPWDKKGASISRQECPTRCRRWRSPSLTQSLIVPVDTLMLSHL